MFKLASCINAAFLIGAGCAVAGTPLTFHVAANGADDQDGSAAHPFKTLERAQAAVRSADKDHDVTVVLADGTYQLSTPLRFGLADGGQGTRQVTWSASPGAHPVISGGLDITGWTLSDKARGIWSAQAPTGLQARQFWVGDKSAQRAQIDISYKMFVATVDGLTIKDASFAYLSHLPSQDQMEVEIRGCFTDRYARIGQIYSDRIVMQQPGWRNNLIGYDVVSCSYAAENAHFYLINALAFLTKPGQWYLDSGKGRLYYKPRPGEDMANVSAVLPRLDTLMSIAGTTKTPVTDLRFTGLTFAHTSWLGPSSPDGFANQQSGTFLQGETPNYPADPLGSCWNGCMAYEAQRAKWHQMPAAFQIAAAARITIDHNVFTHLGQVALGIGNDEGANLSGIGLSTAAIDVSRNRFEDISAGAMVAGGIGVDAHHPSVPQLANRALEIDNNEIKDFGTDYKDAAAILITYLSGAAIVHNDVSGGPYDAIDIGWGWGMFDAGTNARYWGRKTYDVNRQLIYDTPTIMKDVVVAYNRVHNVKRLFHDGGAIYHLSANPGGIIANNFIYDVNKQIGVYLDEASRYVTVRSNVIQDAGLWLNANTAHEVGYQRITIDNTASGNWHRGGEVGGEWTDYMNNKIVDDHPVAGDYWPADAKAVIEKSGIEPNSP